MKTKIFFITFFCNGSTENGKNKNCINSWKEILLPPSLPRLLFVGGGIRMTT